MQVAALAGPSYPMVRSAIDPFDDGVWPSIAGRPRPQRRPRAAAPRRAGAVVRRAVRDKRPGRLQMELALRTRGVVVQYIGREHGARLSVRATGEYPRRRGSTPPKPVKRAYEQRPEAVRQWLACRYPAIERLAKAEGRWSGETAPVNTEVRGRRLARRGKTPVTTAVGGTRAMPSMISTATNQGRANRMIVGGDLDHERFIELLQAPVRDDRRRRRKVVLFPDNLGVHHREPAKAWLAEHQADIEALFGPSHSPESNPGERLDADLKQAVGSQVLVRTDAKSCATAGEHMHFIATSRDRARARFHDPIANFAADGLHLAGSAGRPAAS